MYGCLICFAAAALGIDVGWQPLPEGGLQYLIQIRPETLDTLKAGEPIESDVPPTLRDIRGYQITVGNRTLPQQPSMASLRATQTPSPHGLQFGRAQGTSIVVGPPSTSPYPSSPAPGPFTPMPRMLSPEPSGKPLAEQPASFVQPSPATVLATPKSDAKPAAIAAADDAQASRLWSYLAGSLVALSGSLAWNGYLLWMLREARRRYRSMLDRGGEEEPEDDEESMSRG